LKVLLLPGLDGTGILFRPLLDALPSTVEPNVVAYPGDEVLCYDDLAARVAALLPTDRTFILVGESFSGPIAVKIAARNPPGLAGVVLCASFVRNPLSFIPSATRHLVRPTPLRLVPQFVQAKALLGGYSSPELRALLGQAWRGVRPEVLAGRIRDLLAVDVRPELRSLSLPVLYLRGTRDRVVPEGNLHDVEGAAKNLEVVRVDAPHLVLQTRPLESVRAIADFAARAPRV
jgi:pimeloyl-ACP methyl ester carboxylesterase